MDSLVLLYLLLPVAFSLHDFEEILFQHSWVLKNQNRIVKKFPFAKNILEHLAKLDTKKFAVIAFEELGCESVKRLEIQAFPVLCAIDSYGVNLFDRK